MSYRFDIETYLKYSVPVDIYYLANILGWRIYEVSFKDDIVADINFDLKTIQVLKTLTNKNKRLVCAFALSSEFIEENLQPIQIRLTSFKLLDFSSHKQLKQTAVSLLVPKESLTYLIERCGITNTTTLSDMFDTYENIILYCIEKYYL